VKRNKVEVLANDVTFVDSRGEGGGTSGGDSSGSAPASSSKPASPAKKKDDVVVDDIGDEPINLDDIPF
jgi:single-stranded DNA-binding protein